MTNRTVAVLSCLMSSLLACTAQSAAPRTDTSAVAMATPTPATAAMERTQVRAVLDSLNGKAVAGMRAQDAAVATQNYADSAVMMMPGMPTMRGRAVIQQGMQGMFDATKVDAATFTTDDVIVSGELAVETGHYEMTMTPKGGRPMQDKGKYLTVWQHQADGTWRIVRDINNSDAAPPG